MMCVDPIYDALNAVYLTGDADVMSCTTHWVLAVTRTFRLAENACFEQTKLRFKTLAENGLEDMVDLY